MSSTWEFLDLQNNNITPSPAPTGTLMLTYDDQGRPTTAAGTVIGTLVCTGTTVATLILSPAGTNVVEMNITHITDLGSTPPPRSSNNGDILTVHFAAPPPTGGEWSWDFSGLNSDVAIALKVKVKVKRPPGEPR